VAVSSNFGNATSQAKLAKEILIAKNVPYFVAAPLILKLFPQIRSEMAELDTALDRQDIMDDRTPFNHFSI
jgi:16S rRNA A1518/A1519 N6-dimethyltransferase RsmA/KsgA/DIM1 with predicted DNA glycosylase/AP lyase activity